VPVPLESEEPTAYEIIVRGTIAEDLAVDIGALRCTASEGRSAIVVDVIDQSHLHGVLDRLGDLNIEIESVNPA
jgi:hypothetical protein